jgi:outer membrane protein TolC
MEMKRWAFLLIFYFISALFSCDTVYAHTSETVSAYVLSDLQYESYPEFSRILFSSNDKISFTTYELQNPNRIVLDVLGVSFCELQEYIEYDEGLVKSIELVKTPYVQKPKGLDEYFYAVDCIIITPRSDFPYTVSSAENGKIIAVDIGTKAPPGIKIALMPQAADGNQNIIQEQVPDGSRQAIAHEPVKEIAQGQALDENVIDSIDFESMDDSTLVVISTKHGVSYTARRQYYPVFNIVLKPQGPIFSDLQEHAEFDLGYIKSVKIIRDKNALAPKTLDEYYYPVEFILIEPAVDLPFDFYSNDDDTISILEIYYPDIKEDIKQAVEDKAVVEPRVYEYEKEEQEQDKRVKQELLTILKEEIKQEGLLKQEKIEGLRKEELGRIKKEASQKAQGIGQEVLKDLFVRGKGVLSLSESQIIALENSPQAKTAKEEVKLAMLKKRDAFRALFPNVKLKASHTIGDVLQDETTGERVAFTEEVYGIEAEHPLYQGGRLMNAYKQSKINTDLAEARHKKIEHELNFKVAEAYHNIVTAIMNLRLQQQLLKEAEPILKLAEKRHEAGLSTNLEILNVQSRYNQIQFQIATAQRDLALSRFKLQQAMGLDISNDDMDVSEVDTELPFKIIDINLYECLEAAASNQPDILVNKLLTESNEYGEKIAKGKESFRVDLTGFYGRADSYYNTEPKNLQADWNVGVKVSKPFWFASPSYSFTKEKTSRKVGQTDRTGTTANAGELALFDKDAFAIGSEIEEARIAKQKAENDLIDTRRQTALSVKEAYYNYQESVIQVKNSLEKVYFHEEAVKAAKAQSELNEALQSQLLESLIQLVDEKSVYIKALSDYNLAIIKINNAIGVRDYFKVD